MMPVFAQHWWLDAVCTAWDAAIVNRGSHCAGIWPYSIKRKLGVTLLRTPMLTPYLGPCIFYPADIKAANTDSYEHETIAELMDLMPEAKVWAIGVQPGLKQAGLFKQHGLDVQVKQTFLIDLQQGEAPLLSNFKESIRRNIKAAEKEIIISDEWVCLPELYNFQKATLLRKRAIQPYTLQHMHQLMEAARKHHAAALWVARKGNTIQAILWNVWDGNTSYYFMGAQNPAADNYKAMSALLWHAMKEAIKRGNSVFDMEGSMDPGVERFFRGFGGKRELYLLLNKNDSLAWRVVRALRK